MIQAILFDFNGVIADDETSHFVCFQQALAEFGLSITADRYYGTYLGMDERTCTALLLAARDGRGDAARVRPIMERKAALFADYTAQHPPSLFPGAAQFVERAREHYRLALASGGRRAQIDRALKGTAIERDFEVIVSAEDCPIGKPDPAIYLLALERLNEQAGRRALKPEHCLVIEDSKAGIRAGRAAGMTVLALSTTYPEAELAEAHAVLSDLERAPLPLDVLFSNPGRSAISPLSG
ncbi:HAD family hydrolase [Nitrospira moscoviensis]|uniref:Putative beta-phosphoglucomutase n=1 Tax=Nitrospira moscoviensis TaxID=42253 RepID=A0A0K2GIX6_NITMO|nr:HAD family phosphatase [Nitrospira moscoviensis]ALA60895.1 putative beta-phosphoglucomutase [Nitrospira moscoviensis]